MTKARTRTARYPQHIREDAFAYYYAGYTRAEVVHRLRLQYGDQAPSPGAVKLWMEQGRWAARRRRIEELVARRSDELRSKQIAAAVTSNQIVASTIKSDRHALSDKERLAEIMKHAIRKVSRNTGAGRQAVVGAEQDAAQEATR